MQRDEVAVEDVEDVEDVEGSEMVCGLEVIVSAL